MPHHLVTPLLRMTPGSPTSAVLPVHSWRRAVDALHLAQRQEAWNAAAGGNPTRWTCYLVQLLQNSSGATKAMMVTGDGVLLQVVHALREAGKDSRVKGLVGIMGSQPAGQMAQIQELRDAVLRFRCRQAA